MIGAGCTEIVVASKLNTLPIITSSLRCAPVASVNRWLTVNTSVVAL